jgi:hypothetical protein
MSHTLTDRIKDAVKEAGEIDRGAHAIVAIGDANYCETVARTLFEEFSKEKLPEPLLGPNTPPVIVEGRMYRVFYWTETQPHRLVLIPEASRKTRPHTGSRETWWKQGLARRGIPLRTNDWAND